MTNWGENHDKIPYHGHTMKLLLTHRLYNVVKNVKLFFALSRLATGVLMIVKLVEQELLNLSGYMRSSPVA